jgi:CHAT domain-containing protein
MGTIISPAGDRVVVDGRENGPETMFLDASTDGIYRLEISFVNERSQPAAYTLRLESVRARKDDDDLRFQAQELTTESKKLGAQRSVPDLHRAVEAGGKALELWHRLGDRQAEASVMVELGALDFALSEIEEAKDFFLKAILLAESESARWTEGEGLNDLGLVLEEAGDFVEANQRTEQALIIWRELGHRYGEAAALSNLGIFCRKTGGYQQAIGYYRQALTILAELGDTTHPAYVLSNLGVALHALADDTAALNAFERAAALFRASKNSSGEARNMVSIARIHLAAHRTAQARAYVQRALPLAESAHNYRTMADGWELSGEILSNLHQQQGALQEFTKAIAAYQQVSDRGGEAGVMHCIGVLYSEWGNTKLALEYLNQAKTSRHELGIRDGEAETLYELARAELMAGELAQAEAHIDVALELVEAIRALVAGPERRMSYLASKHQYYSLACEIYRRLDQAKPDQGFAFRGLEIAERGRARSLLDEVSEGLAGAQDKPPSELAVRERKLRERLNFLSWKVTDSAEKGDRQKQESATHKLDVALDEYHELESQIRVDDPRYSRLAPRPLSVAEIRNRVLDSDTVLLEYSLGQEHSSVWVVTTDSLSLYALRSRGSIEHSAQLFFESLRAEERSQRDSDFLQKARTLSRMLLPPDPHLLGTKRLLIVGDGVLQRIPFGVLLDRGLGVRLVEKHEIVLSPSASVLAAERQEEGIHKPTSKALAVIADPVFDAGDARTERPVSGGTPEFARLSYSRYEAEAISKLVPPQKSLLALDFAADRELFVSGRLAQYRMLHIATHAVIDIDRPELSALVLSMVDKKGSPREGHLRMYQIPSLRLPARTVTLSACGTGLGKDVRGEGTVGLARGFLDGGASAVVVSLWDVEDESTAELMKLFYESMLGPRHLSPAAALRAAQLRMLHEKRWSPYHWAGWMVMGDWR